MKPELMLLAWAVALTLVQMLVAASGSASQVGVMPLFGNREGLPALTGWAGRAQRAHHNMIENLVLFAALVLIAVVSQKTNDTTVLGAQLFFWARLAYALLYVAGVPYLRTAAWLVSIIGLVMIFLQLL
ncbi:MAG TPA: MAPEG family protein [Burkholderiales bacterium]|nr:MAPEG family protein [Burkholderiales bacterium]